jgi:hypothetical protein
VSCDWNPTGIAASIAGPQPAELIRQVAVD